VKPHPIAARDGNPVAPAIPEGAACGLDTLCAWEGGPLRGARVGLLANHAAVTHDGLHAAEVLGPRAGIEVALLLGPEHGVWGTHQDMEPVATATHDPVFGLPSRSLYGASAASLRPAEEILEGLDAVVYDLRDIGTRYYTFAATLAFVLEAAAAVGVPVWVLDRPNPLGERVEGPRLRPGFESFCGIEPGLPIRHGLTVGALSRWYAARRAPGAALHVVGFDPDARPLWVPPSPNMPTLETALIYPGLCLLEGTTWSEGRGTTTPFTLLGAPGVDPLALARDLRARELPGVVVTPRRFRPAFQKHAGEVCGGVGLTVTDPEALRPVELGVHVLDAARRVAPETFAWRRDAYEFVEDVPAIDLLWGSDALRRTLDDGAPVAPLLEAAAREAAEFAP